MQAVFLLAEATIVMLKNIVTKLASRSEMKKKLAARSMYDEYRRLHITDERILQVHDKKMMNKDKEFEVEEGFLRNLRSQVAGNTSCGLMETENMETNTSQTNDKEEKTEKEELKSLLEDYNYATPVPVKKLPTNLFDLKNLLQVRFRIVSPGGYSQRSLPH
jgi:formate dehydrogenase assembly factor FdhD